MAKKGRPTNKVRADRRWTDVTRQLLHHTSMIAYLSRDASAASLEQTIERMESFRDAWVRTGDGDVLPCSGQNADMDGALCDVDVFDVVIEVLQERLSSAK